MILYKNTSPLIQCKILFQRFFLYKKGEAKPAAKINHQITELLCNLKPDIKIIISLKPFKKTNV